MRFGLNYRRTHRRYGPIGLALCVVLPVGWAGGYSWYASHVQQKTGRSEAVGVFCSHCHLTPDPPSTREAVERSPYISPSGLAVSPTGDRLFVAAEEAGRLLVVDLSSGKVVESIEVPGGPHDVAVSADGRRLAVSCRDFDQLVILDAATLAIEKVVAAAAEPLGLTLSGDGGRAYVATGRSQDLLIAPLDSGSEPLRLAAGTEPYAVALSADERLLAVANRRVQLRAEPAIPASEVTLIDPVQGRVVDRRALSSAHLAEGVAVNTDGSFALVPVLRIRNFLPTTQVERGALMNSALAFVEARPRGRVVQFPLDEVNAFYADPSGIVLTPDDRIAFVAHGGAQVVSAIDVSALRKLLETMSATDLERLADDLGAYASYVLSRIPTRANPRALALSPDGERLYVAERLAGSIAVIDVDQLSVIGRIELGGLQELTAARRGERLFHDAAVTFQGQFSCRSCHPDGHTDGLNWDFEIDGIGKNRLDTRSLLGLRDTAPFKWNGKNPDLQTQCGPRFARVLTRSDPFPRRELEDLVTYIESLPLPAKRPISEPAVMWERGRTLFFRTQTNDGVEIPVANRCDTCHRPPLYTDRLKAEVGSGGSFDTPHLLDVATTAPYLHDGRALTLEEIWTVHNPDDTHGATNDLTKVELNDLIVYLRSL